MDNTINWTLIFYETEKGECPVEFFLDSLKNKKMRAKADRSLHLLEEFGNKLALPHSRQIKDGVCELRIKFSSDIVRVFYFFTIGSHIIATNGFVKKTQKTPSKEIDKAIKYKKDYLERHP